MASTIETLTKKGLIHPPENFLVSNTIYETVMGSHAFGVADTSVKDKIPDYDVYGCCIPPKDILFPHLQGKIVCLDDKGSWVGFGSKPRTFEQYQKHHIFDPDAHGGKGKEWDLVIYNVVKYFELCRKNVPNMIDSLFTREEHVLHCTLAGRIIRDNRKLFLSKECWKKYRGYAASELKKADNKVNCDEMLNVLAFETDYQIPHSTKFSEVEEALKEGYSSLRGRLAHLNDEELQKYYDLFKEGNEKTTRFEHQKEFQMDRKFLYHILRLYDEVEQILLDGDLDLQRAKETMKAVRRGEWTLEQIKDWMFEKDKALESAYATCKLRERPDEQETQKVLMNVLEEHYGSLENVIVEPDWSISLLKDMDNLLSQWKNKIWG